MSIHEFHAQLTQSDPPNALICALGRFTFTNDPAVLAHVSPPNDPSNPVWAGGLTSE